MRHKYRSDVPLETIRECERLEREQPEQMAFTDRLLCGISHDYEIPYFDRFDDLQHCTIHPGDGALEEIEIDGFPDDEESQEKVAREFVRAVSGDWTDFHLASRLTGDEQDHVDALQYRTSADRSFEAMVAEWAAEDSGDDDQQSRREIIAEFHRLASRIPMLRREGFGPHIAELSNMLAGDVDEFDAPRAEALLSSLSAFGPSRF